MTKHTPGPWRVQPTSMTGQSLVAGGDIRDHDGFSVQFSTPNARLIAAAPDMLAALKTIDAATRNGQFDDNRMAEFNAAFRVVRAAIAKAEGRNDDGTDRPAAEVSPEPNAADAINAIRSDLAEIMK